MTSNHNQSDPTCSREYFPPPKGSRPLELNAGEAGEVKLNYITEGGHIMCKIEGGVCSICGNSINITQLDSGVKKVEPCQMCLVDSYNEGFDFRGNEMKEHAEKFAAGSNTARIEYKTTVVAV